MGAIDRLWTCLCSLDRFMLFLLIGAIAFSIALVVLLWTRWGHSRSLEKCVLLSFLAHALLTGYAATVQIASYRPAPREQFIRIALIDGPAGAQHGQADGSDPAAGPVPAKNPPLSAIPADKDRTVVKKLQTPPAADNRPVVDTVGRAKAARPAAPAATQQALKQLAVTASAASGWQMATAAGKYLQEFSTAHAAEMNQVVTALTSPPPATTLAPTSVSHAGAAATATVSGTTSDASAAAEAAAGIGAMSMPETYKLRVTGDHVGTVLAGGGSKETEAAGQAALRWLAEHQS